MNILAIESSGLTAGCAYVSDGRLVSEYYMNNKLTHSTTLLPMVEQMQKVSGFVLSDLDAVAVSQGPGSFTGLRIGAATAKGLCLALSIPIIGVSSLKGLAANLALSGMMICPIMDARQGQVYGAVYVEEDIAEPYHFKALLEDTALSAEDYLQTVAELMKETGKRPCFTGDGVPVHETKIRELFGDTAVFAPTTLNRQRAASIAVLGEIDYAAGRRINADDFVPVYVRKPLAESKQEAGLLEDAGKRSLEKIARGIEKVHPAAERSNKR